jgi:valyl-tRNA synthetase
VRYWAASARLGIDAALDTAQMKVGRRLAIKVLNASRFALSFGDVGASSTTDLAALVTEPLDRAMLATLGDVVELATSANDAMDYTRALEVTESFFWSFCDDYLELVKDRAYGGGAGRGAGDEPGPGAVSARAALRLALDIQLRLLAPVVVFATEEVWSWFHAPAEGSIHRAPWPTTAEIGDARGADSGLLAAVGEALAGVRKAKSEAKVGMRAEITSMSLVGAGASLDRVRTAEGDLRSAGRIRDLAYAVEEPAGALVVKDAVIVPPEPRQRG